MTLEQGDRIIAILKAIERDLDFIKLELASLVVRCDRMLSFRPADTEH